MLMRNISAAPRLYGRSHSHTYKLIKTLTMYDSIFASVFVQYKVFCVENWIQSLPHHKRNLIKLCETAILHIFGFRGEFVSAGGGSLRGGGGGAGTERRMPNPSEKEC